MRTAWVVCLLVLAGCAPPGPEKPAACAVNQGALPDWARAGFSPPDQQVRYALGAQGEILGVLFTDSLQVPPPPTGSNKILWVSKSDSAGPLKIDATLAGSGLTTTREVPDGPGPSNVDLPAPGCWSLELSWPGHHDRVELPYRAGG
ncbi:hypothetical protein [Amycolatopsis sp. GM8]|uniref:hypothetical protein n=1 Tax=Amycolatopsis sp. GM8 TaxID=2896530 RepID=UPI001F34EC6A|nr:hypothetical protein [Amycolatopsis sp. GM8]